MRRGAGGSPVPRRRRRGRGTLLTSMLALAWKVVSTLGATPGLRHCSTAVPLAQSALYASQPFICGQRAGQRGEQSVDSSGRRRSRSGRRHFKAAGCPGPGSGQAQAARPSQSARSRGGGTRAHPMHGIRHADGPSQRGEAAVGGVGTRLARLQKQGPCHAEVSRVQAWSLGAGRRRRGPVLQHPRLGHTTAGTAAAAVAHAGTLRTAGHASAAPGCGTRWAGWSPALGPRRYAPCTGATWSSQPCRAWPRTGSACRWSSLRAGRAVAYSAPGRAMPAQQRAMRTQQKH